VNPIIGILGDIVHLLRLILFGLLDILGTLIRPVLAGIGLLGFVMSAFYALVAPYSHFPHKQALAFSAGCFVLVVLYDVIIYAIKPKQRAERFTRGVDSSRCE